MNHIELAVMLFFGFLLVVTGTEGVRIYAKLFLHAPTTTISADVLFTSLKGPGIIPVVLCGMTILGGIYCIALSIYIIIADMGRTLFNF